MSRKNISVGHDADGKHYALLFDDKPPRAHKDLHAALKKSNGLWKSPEGKEVQLVDFYIAPNVGKRAKFGKQLGPLGQCVGKPRAVVEIEKRELALKDKDIDKNVAAKLRSELKVLKGEVKADESVKTQ